MTALEGEPPVHALGNWIPVREERSLDGLRVDGVIPAELDGRYVRNGANSVTGQSDHPFFGDGMIHGIRLRDGRAEWYRNRYVRTPFVTAPGTSIEFEPGKADLSASKANTSIVAHAGQLLALNEGHFPWVLDGDLQTIGPTDFDGELTGSFTAHPKICPVSGEMLAFGYSHVRPYLRYLRISADGHLEQVEDITVGGPTMMHDFNVTENHVIFMDLPAVFDMELAMRGELPIRWSDDYAPVLRVMPRDGNDSDVVQVDVDPCYVFHPMNAYEDGGEIVIDVARLDHIWRDGPMDFPDPTLHRWRIDLNHRSVGQEQLDDTPAEFPRVADDRVGQPYRFGYMMANGPTQQDPLTANGAILKYDLVSGQRTEIRTGKGRLPGESSFVGRAGAVSEDDGYLMTFVYDASSDTSEFVIFDAQSMDDEPIARVALPRIPFGFHGNWVPATAVD